MTVKELIDILKQRITKCQRQIAFFESQGNGGSCISLNGKIQAYNEVIKDLQTLNLHP